MAKIVNMHDAKSTLSSLVEEAEAGVEIIIARAGRPAVRLVPVKREVRRALGRWQGKVRMADDFDAPLPAEVLSAWNGNEE